VRVVYSQPSKPGLILGGGYLQEREMMSQLKVAEQARGSRDNVRDIFCAGERHIQPQHVNMFAAQRHMILSQNQTQASPVCSGEQLYQNRRATEKTASVAPAIATFAETAEMKADVPTTVDIRLNARTTPLIRDNTGEGANFVFILRRFLKGNQRE
jgi:hypothetical protein